MFPHIIGNDVSHHDLSNALSLALSASQTQSNILEDGDLFSKTKETHNMELIQLDPNPSRDYESLNFRDAAQLSSHFQSSGFDAAYCHFPVEIYLIHQQDTWSSLNVSRDMICILLDRYILGPGFLHMLACFRDRYLPTEEGFSGAPQTIISPGRSEFGWVYKYSEKKDVRFGNPWRIRHTGIYQVHDHVRGKSVLIIVSPSPTAHFTSYLRDTLRQSQFRSILLANPMVIHTMLISSHLYSWRGYLEYQETLLIKLDMQSACTALEDPLVSFDTLKEVRVIEKHILPIEQITNSFYMQLDGLQRAFEQFVKASDADQGLQLPIRAAIEQFRSDATSYKNQAMHIFKKTQSTAQSISDSLNLTYQQLAQSQNRNTFMMATSARDDSIAIRAITLVTSFYLPFSFVATIFGMNLVDFDSQSRNLAVSNQMWLYFVISVPLTAVTLLCWRWRMRIYRQGYGMEDMKSQDDTKSLRSNSDIEMV
ncbi:hypothetical protein P171DRAFT_491170 [Karstenula rhodostoma CBS 690.94]|uniref:CorA-like transporter domain-containing protein n=1 Tax=Karstenula rhodostoma CBS 690.94 TaxID=1392251 RepID=A0A9P4P520_9PLEO|nr:hypothetical protein P171DRAFT_491170 [Karstenula rhodostoma CBS 690.94]